MWICPKCGFEFDGGDWDGGDSYYCFPCNGLPNDEDKGEAALTDMSPEELAKLTPCKWVEEDDEFWVENLEEEDWN